MRRFKSFLLAALFAVCTFGFAACRINPSTGSGSGSNTDPNESDFVAVEGAGFNPDEKYKLNELDFKNKDYLDASKNDEVLGIFKDNAQAVQDKTAGTLSGAVQNAVGDNATFAITLNYESYTGTVIEFTTTVNEGTLDLSFHSQEGVWDRNTYNCKLRVVSDTHQITKFGKYKSVFELMSPWKVIDLRNKKITYRLAIKNAEAWLYVVDFDGAERQPMRKQETPPGQDEQWVYTNINNVKLADQSQGLPIPTDVPYSKMARDIDNPFTSGYLAITWYAPARNSDITLHSYKIYTPYSAVNQ
ncbi:hypothetical protein FACS1894211_11460 [Clostridia bacterium]|nr:hypothetical protein FACS1894211_11460 [Clostridia bacterium]